jgi:hypothetical protein
LCILFQNQLLNHHLLVRDFSDSEHGGWRSSRCSRIPEQFIFMNVFVATMRGDTPSLRRRLSLRI